MKKQQKRKIIVVVAPVGKQIEAPSINPWTPEEVARELETQAGKQERTADKLPNNSVSISLRPMLEAKDYKCD